MTYGNLRTQTLRWLRTHGITVSKRLGQHFLVDETVLEHILNQTRITATDILLEIGPGAGTLTKALTRSAQRVIAIEKDSRFFQALQSELGANPRLTIVRGDALKIEWPFCTKLVANLPYGISSPTIFKFLASKTPIAVLMLQREFAERLVAPVGTKDYGRLTVMVGYLATVELLEQISSKCFYPEPAVDSALVRITKRDTPALALADPELFAQLVRTLFGQRRKKVRTPLSLFIRQQGLPSTRLQHVLGRIPWLDRRAEELSPQELAQIANTVHEELTP
jgi:16S rRNA (adenine1518-N6/adenine1519-N6)-dimethyltransferase